MQNNKDRGKASLEKRVGDLERRIELLEKRLFKILEASTDVLIAVQKLVKVISEQVGVDWEEYLRKATEEH